MKKKSKFYESHKVRNFIITFGLLGISFFVVFKGIIDRNFVNQAYPLVFVDSNNKLMYINKSDNNKNDIAAIENANIVYTNKDTTTLLYLNGKALYLLDTSVGGVGIKMTDNPISYGFSKDDKYVYYITSNKDLYIYNIDNKETTNIFSNVSKVEVINHDDILLNQDNKLVYYNIKDGSNIVVSSSYHDVSISNNNLILYSVVDSNLDDYYLYNINNKDNTLLVAGVSKLYDYSSNYQRLVYSKPAEKPLNYTDIVQDDYAQEDKGFVITDNNKEEAKKVNLRNQIRDYLNKYLAESNDLYYQNGAEIHKVASNINELYYIDLRNQRYSYTKNNWDTKLNINDYTDIEKFTNDIESSRLNSVYYKQATYDESLVYKNLIGKPKIIIRDNTEYYLIIPNGEYFDLYYSLINNRELSIANLLDSNLVSDEINVDYQNGYLYQAKKDDKIGLKILAKGNSEVLEDDILKDSYAVNEAKTSIYYIKKVDEYKGDLILYNGIRKSKIAQDIHGLIYINNDVIYVTKDYDMITNTSDLYRLVSNNHVNLIYENIANWYDPSKEKFTTSDEKIEKDALINASELKK